MHDTIAYSTETNQIATEILSCCTDGSTTKIVQVDGGDQEVYDDSEEGDCDLATR